MTYKYTSASMSATAKKGDSPKNDYINLFQETLNEQFFNASNWWTVQEEVTIGSGVYQDTDVRLTHVINAETGLKLGDDWKTVLFKEIDHPIELGKLYIFDNNTWITVNSEIIKNLAGTCTIRRCNNTLRWIDEATGAFYEEPCAIEYMVKEPRDYATAGSPFITPGGFLHIEAQFNERTNKIKENQRFLFGNPQHWTAYKVIGTGLNDFRNMETYDRQSAKILTIDLVANFVNNELDDIVNGYADANTNLYTIALDKTIAEGDIGEIIQLRTTITYNGNSVTRPVIWTTSDADIATVNSSGLVTLVALGNCTITATIENNPVNATCAVTVTATPAVNDEAIISPNTNYILEGSQRTYSVYLYKNDIQQADTFILTCYPNGVPSANYIFTQIDGNHFVVSNKIRSSTSYLTVECVSGSVLKNFDIYLRGAW